MTYEESFKDYLTRVENRPDQDQIVREGSRIGWIACLLEGRIKVKKKTALGVLAIDTLGPGAFVGDLPFGEGVSEFSPVSLTADGPVRLGFLDPTRLMETFRGLSPEMRTLIRGVLASLDTALTELGS